MTLQAKPSHPSPTKKFKGKISAKEKIQDLHPMEIQPDHKELFDLAGAKMPFGKYKGRYLSDLPEYYLVWYRQKGFPAGKLGKQMAQVFELQLNGMESILRTIRTKYFK